MAYATLAQLRGMLNDDDQSNDVELSLALNAAGRCVDEWCGQSFEPAGSTSTRRYTATSWGALDVDPFNTTTGLVVASDDNDDGTAETTWTISTDFEVGPAGGVGPDGRTGWPYTQIIPVGDKAWPRYTRRQRPIYVTANWGWAATPEPVTYATLLLAHDLWRSRTAPFGVAGFGDYGVLRLRQNQKVVELLAVYQTGRALLGMA